MNDCCDNSSSADCCCARGDVLLLACSGGSNVGQLTNEAAKALDQLGIGSFSCLIGIGAELPSFIAKAKADDMTVVLLDGCPTACGQAALGKLKLEADVYLDVTTLGIAKTHNLIVSRDEVALVAGAVAEMLKKLDKAEVK